jgi:hypothetical protein
MPFARLRPPSSVGIVTEAISVHCPLWYAPIAAALARDAEAA